MFRKNDRITRLDIQDKLCMMVVMVQASYRTNKDFLRIFRTDEKYQSFFPNASDYQALNDLLSHYPDLEKDADEYANFPGVSVRQSLVNVFKMCRPLVVLDEGHKTYSEKARAGINKFNPKMVLELTAPLLRS